MEGEQLLPYKFKHNLNEKARIQDRSAVLCDKCRVHLSCEKKQDGGMATS